jgi:hypothetical protein
VRFPTDRLPVGLRVRDDRTAPNLRKGERSAHTSEILISDVRSDLLGTFRIRATPRRNRPPRVAARLGPPSGYGDRLASAQLDDQATTRPMLCTRATATEAFS